MSNLASSAFLNHLKSLFPLRNNLLGGNVASQNPWCIVATVGFSASNRPEAMPSIFQHISRDMDNPAQKLLLARKMRDALFKSGLISGYPRAINSLVALHESMPEGLRDTKMMRNTTTSIEDYHKIGQSFFRFVYGDQADPVQRLLDSVYPDMGWFSNTIGYGLMFGFTPLLSPLETSYALVAALIAGDTPRQIIWHLEGARRIGASLEEIRAVREMSMKVASRAGVEWKEGVPEVADEL